MSRPSQRQQDEVVQYHFKVEWSLYDIAGNRLETDSKFFEEKPQAVKFAEKLKRDTPTDKNAIINIRELDTNEIIRRFKKRSGNKNFRNHIRR